MQKTTKLLLTKIFVLLAVIFCVFALSLGAIGCANEEEAKVITGIKVNGTTITVTYSDGSTEDLAVEGTTIDNSTTTVVPAEDCGHDANNFVSTLFLNDEAKVNVNANVCSLDVYECAVCGHLFAEEHAHVLAEEAKEEKPTCVKTGYKGFPCTNKGCHFVDGETLEVVDHTYGEVKSFVLPEGFDKCLNDWYEKGTICTVCGDFNPEMHDKLAHKGSIETFGVTKTPTQTEAGAIGGYCSSCKKVIDVEEIPALTDSRYRKEATPDTNGHKASYFWTATYEEIEGDEITVIDKQLELHEAKFVNYDADEDVAILDVNIKGEVSKTEKLGLNLIDGKKLTCDSDLVAENADYQNNMAYLCADCKRLVTVTVQAAHTKVEPDETKPETLVKYELGKFEDEEFCDLAGKMCYDCSECDDDHPYKVSYAANGSQNGGIDHAFEVVGKPVKDGNTYKIYIECTRCDYKPEEPETAKSFTEPSCCEKGSVTREDGSVIELDPTGDHIIVKGASASQNITYNASKDADTVYDYEDVKNVILIFQDDPIVCADYNNNYKTVEVGVKCSNEECDKSIFRITVKREHKKLDHDVDGTCVEATETFKCEYEDCVNYDTLYEGPAGVKHTYNVDALDFTVDQTGAPELAEGATEAGIVKATCTVDGCGVAIEYKYQKFEVTDKSCEDYKDGDTNCDIYKLYDKTTGVFYIDVIDAFDNTVHVFNDKAYDISTYEFAVDFEGLMIFTDADLNCTTPEEEGGAIICDDCGRLIKVTVIGKHTFSAESETDKDDAATCQVAQNSYWQCITCDMWAIKEELAQPTGHKFAVKSVNGKDVILECSNVNCDLVDSQLAVNLDNCTPVPSEDCQYKYYSFVMKKAENLKTQKYELDAKDWAGQTVDFKIESGKHTFIETTGTKYFYFSNGKDGYFVANYCSVCKQLVIVHEITVEKDVKDFEEWYAENPNTTAKWSGIPQLI